MEVIGDIWPVVVGCLTVYTAFLMGYIYFIVDRRTKVAVSLERKEDKKKADKFRKELQESFDETLTEIQDTIDNVVKKEHLQHYLKGKDIYEKFYSKELSEAKFLTKDSANSDFIKKSDI
jgi:hypothetical protein